MNTNTRFCLERLGDFGLVKGATTTFDRTALVDDLKMAGFEDSIAQTIADRVDSKKAKQWTYDMGRQQAIKEAHELLQRTHQALDNFRSSTLTTTGQQHSHQPLAEKIGDPGMAI